MVRELTAKGYGSASRKYLVFLDATRPDICGLGTVYPDDSAGTGNTNNVVKGYAVVFNGCWSSTGTIAHELGHNFGAVQASAPNATSWSHCTDEWDLMCYLDGSGEPMVTRCDDPTYQILLDCNHNDYFHTNPPVGNYLRTHWNVARSSWLGVSGAPPPTTVPGNDAISRAAVVGSLPFVAETNTLWATMASSEPSFPGEDCWGNVWKTVWYRLTVPATGDYVVDTVGSAYDTVVQAFAGTPGRSTRLACNDDLDDVVLDSRITLPDLTAGSTVHVMVGAYANSPDGFTDSPGGYLRLNIARAPQLALATTYGGYNTEVDVALAAFPPNATVALTFGGVALVANGAPVTIRTDADGAAEGSFRVPSARKGVHTVRAVAPGDVVGSARFRVTPRLRVSPSARASARPFASRSPATRRGSRSRSSGYGPTAPTRPCPSPSRTGPAPASPASTPEAAVLHHRRPRVRAPRRRHAPGHRDDHRQPRAGRLLGGRLHPLPDHRAGRVHGHRDLRRLRARRDGRPLLGPYRDDAEGVVRGHPKRGGHGGLQAACRRRRRVRHRLEGPDQRPVSHH
jgi:hypothetical protein